MLWLLWSCMDSDILTISLLNITPAAFACLPPRKAEPSGEFLPWQTLLRNCCNPHHCTGLDLSAGLGRYLAINNSQLQDGQEGELTQTHHGHRNVSSCSEEAQLARAVVAPAISGEAFLCWDELKPYTAWSPMDSTVEHLALLPDPYGFIHLQNDYYSFLHRHYALLTH